jgi:hypothetical protein
LYALGKCWKREGWIISMYQRIGDRYATLKIKRMKSPAQETSEMETYEEALKLLMGESRGV